jgi:hypothetical protein
MATPEWLHHDNFESGDNTGWTGFSDGSVQMDFPHYTELARVEGMSMPYSGAYCARIQMVAGNTADIVVTESTIAIATTEDAWFRFNIWISPETLSDTALSDEIKILEVLSAAPAVQFVMGLNIDKTANDVEWACGAADLTVNSTAKVEFGVWYTVECHVYIDTGAANGYIKVYVTKDGEEPSSTVTVELTGSQSGGNVTNGKFGVQEKLTGTVGTILLDDFIMTTVGSNNQNRIWPDKDRFSTTKTITHSQHVFLGKGTVSGVSLRSSGAADNIITIYDTDTSQTHQASKKLILQNDTAGQMVQSDTGVPFDVIRGCYVEFSGPAGYTETPEVTISISRAPNWFDEGSIRRHALQRRL